ncbi:unnamed protein product [Haemonchus placei]|uniref:Secreted protein n=1 Tax=Haemonchus placei TaxID=6290 RepID=A0A0N4WJ76_HAEPC|nr:unnamed protein product [Haemonchus placei]
MGGMSSFALCVLLATMALSLADCGCGAKCAIYTDPAKCTRCCTATVKRSLSSSSISRRSHRFLLPQMVGNPIRVPMWLAAAAYSYSPSSSSSKTHPLISKCSAGTVLISCRTLFLTLNCQ